MSARNTTQKRRNSTGGSWSVLKRTSWQNWWGSQQGKAPAGPAAVNKEGLVGDVTVGGYPGHGDHMTWWQRIKERLIFNNFFASVFNSQTVFSKGTQLPELEDRDSEHNEAPLKLIGISRPIIRGQLASDLLQHTKVHIARWDSPKSTGGAGGRAEQATLHHLSAVLAQWGGLSWLEGNQC